MSKVIRVLSNEENIDYEDILSFTTENFIGFWDYESDGRYILIKKSRSGVYIYPIHAPTNNLDELDSEVYKLCKEHILEVFDHDNYEINLT